MRRHSPALPLSAVHVLSALSRAVADRGPGSGRCGAQLCQLHALLLLVLCPQELAISQRRSTLARSAAAWETQVAPCA